MVFWEIMMNRLDEMLEVPEERFRGGRVRMQAIKCVVVGDGAVGRFLGFFVGKKKKQPKL